ncbi:ABC transporter ATP-binding protein [Hyphomicrobium sp.]|uniref:ABC transporter ATP-binding protein n=1 Tax=Hyphomicrobium sp. TaxID=82 RepID=UPI0025B86649|nr:ABC transporter ATP-binding protein [Hyphomicrobium sp.]MCC7253454.1 ABC transporter ATP-binding protein [Hyphomicrobium sp.]
MMDDAICRSEITLTNVSIAFPLVRYQARQSWVAEAPTKTGGKIERSERGVTRICALEDISLTVNAGDRIGILGHNGAGKSTLLRVVVGVYPPSKGAVRVRGRIASMIDIHTGFDNASTGIENIRLRAMFMNIPPKLVEDRLPDVAEFAGLGDYLNLPLATYSSGMRARLAFAIATGFDPEIVVMDEWLSAGDRAFREKAEARMDTFVDQADILVIASHSDPLLMRVCNRAIVLDGGRIVFDGPVKDAIELRKSTA